MAGRDAPLGIAPVVRSMLEGLAHLVNLRKYDDYETYMMLDHAARQVKLIETAQRLENEYLKGLGEFVQDNEEEQARVNAWREETAADKEILGKYNFMRAKFESAEMTSEYEAVYSHLSAESHGGVAQLLGRHWEELDEAVKFVRLRNNRPFGGPIFLIAAAGILVQSIQNLEMLLEAEHDESLDDLRAIVSRLGDEMIS